MGRVGEGGEDSEGSDKFPIPGGFWGLGWDTSLFLSSGVISVMAVPEPSTLPLRGLGLFGCILLSRRQKKLAANPRRR